MLLSDYKKVKIPVYLLEGEHSPIVISEVQKTLLHTFPNALRSIIDGAGHMAPITHPEEFAKEVKNFIEP
jgi:pimeloyl-ACP methyl ester carboxylesterase